MLTLAKDHNPTLTNRMQPLGGAHADDVLPSNGPRIFQGEIKFTDDGCSVVIHSSDVTSYEEQERRTEKNSNNNNSTRVGNCPGGNNRPCVGAEIPKYLTFVNDEKVARDDKHDITDAECVAGIDSDIFVPGVRTYRVHTFRGERPSDESSLMDILQRAEYQTTSDEHNASYPRHPILMCFPCRLTFGRSSSFLDHVTCIHQVVSTEAERRLLELGHVCAVLQETSDGKSMVCFLEHISSLAQSPSGNTGVAEKQGDNCSGAIIPDSECDNVSTESDNNDAEEFSAENKEHLDEKKNILNKSRSPSPSICDDPVSLDVLDLSKSVTSSPSATTPSRIVMSFAVASPTPISVHTSPSTSRGNLFINSVGRDMPDFSRDSHENAMTSLARSGDSPERRTLDVDVKKHTISQPSSISMISSQNPNVSSPSPNQRVHNNHMNEMATTTSGSDSMFPMSLFQSRNSCKTLKCPKCNWHYKYRQTLEAHMKEKHMEDTTDCGFCNSGQPHPRLSRGESYSCGYKPFKCTVCNYSTTTKGNLSIHMQSDKHLYNARSLQHRQEGIRQDVATSTYYVPRQQLNRDDTPSLDEANKFPQALNESLSPQNRQSPLADAKSVAQNRRHRSSSRSGQEVPSKTSQGRRESASGNKWRCDVCGYETSIARNLRIHMTSEKHAQNVALMDRGLGLPRDEHDSRIDRIKHSAPLVQASPIGLMEYYAAAFKNLRNQVGEGDSAEQIRNAQAEYLQQQLLISQQQQLFLAQQYQQVMMAAAASSIQQKLASVKSNESGSNQRAIVAQKPTEESSVDQSPAWNRLLNSLEEHGHVSGHAGEVASSKLFSCGLCGIFGCDDLSDLDRHMRLLRQPVGSNESCEWVTRNSREGFVCKLCKYATPLKTNFNLHCKTEKHTSKLCLISHVREGGSATEWMIPHVVAGNISQSVSCNACRFVSSSLEKMKMHVVSDQHQGVLTVCQYLDSLMRSHKDKETGNFEMRCLACMDFNTKHVVDMVRHMQSSEHQNQLQSHSMTTLQDVISIEPQASSAPDFVKANGSHDNGPTKREEPEAESLQCQYCNYRSKDEGRMRLHTLTQHNSQPPVKCSICQDVLKDSIQLQLHFAQVHGKSSGTSKPNDATDESGERSTNVTFSEGNPQMAMETTQKEDTMEMQTDSIKNEDRPMAGDESQIGSIVGNLDSTPTDLSLKGTPNNGTLKPPFACNPCEVTYVYEADLQRHLASDEHRARVGGKSDQNNKDEPTSNGMDLVSRSCPNLVASVGEQPRRGRIPDVRSLYTQSKSGDAPKQRRMRVRSCPLDSSSRSRACERLLSKYGLEQAKHYVENRSPENRSKAKTWKLENRWNGPLDDSAINGNHFANATIHDGNTPTTQKEMSDSKHLKTSNGNQGDRTSQSCRFCGKEFTGLWVLKAHEEVAHGVCVPTNAVQSLAEAYTDPFKEPRPDRSGHANNVERVDINMNHISSAEPNVKQPNASIMGQNTDENQLKESALQQQQQKLQQSMFLKAILNARNNSQEQPDSNSIADKQQMFMGDSSMLSMNLYSALLQAQAQAAGLTPYQLIANAAAVQQIQQLSMSGMPAFSEEMASKAQLFGHGPSSGLDAFQKKEQGNMIQGSPHFGPQHQAPANTVEIPVKRPRTRITDDQLKVLRANFDINNSPSESQIDDMAAQTTLPPKVIKHWFRNTLFKERQRSKDSPYNFSIPPLMSLEDAYRSSSSKDESSEQKPESTSSAVANDQGSSPKATRHEQQGFNVKSEPAESMMEGSLQIDESDHGDVEEKPDTAGSTSLNPNTVVEQLKKELSEDILRTIRPMGSKVLPQNMFTNALSLVPNLSQASSLNPITANGEEFDLNNAKQSLPQQFSNWSSKFNEGSGYMDGSFESTPSNQTCRRTPRTRFTDFQIQVLQEFFDRNAYPKDDDLDKLSKTLDLSTRVIVVWFQNARQKARKNFEQSQQPHVNISPGQPIQTTSYRPVSPIVEEAIAKARMLTKSAGKPDVENLERKVVSEVSKNISAKIEAKHALNQPEVQASSIRKPSTEITPPARPRPTSLVENKDDKSNFPCPVCDLSFPTIPQWQAHMQVHLAANVASVFGQYSFMYMQGLMGDKEQNVTEKIMEDKRAANDWSNSLDKTPWNGNQQWMKPNHVDPKSFNHVRRVSEDKSGTVRSRLVTPPMGGTKRKLSTSPTLSQSSSSSASPSLVQNSMMRHKGSFMDERDSMGKDPKRLRTTITPEQLEYLYQQYLVDSSPSRKIIEQISEAVGLKKRVVQVWFQNTRARERKGQFRSSVARCASGQIQYKFCQLCRMVFRSKIELDTHMQIRHNEQASRDESCEKKIKLSDNTSQAQRSPTAGKEGTAQEFRKSNSRSSLDGASTGKLFYNLYERNLSPVSSRNMPTTKQENMFNQEPEYTANTAQPSHIDTLKELFGGINTGNASTMELQQKLAALYAARNDSHASLEPSASLGLQLASSKASQVDESRERVSSPLAPLSSISLDAQNQENPPEQSGTSSSNQTNVSGSLFSQSSVNMQNFHPFLNDGSYTPPKRFRTQMSSLQVRALKSCFRSYKTPSLTECEILGSEVGLPKRVIQVWFQNARAKEKKYKLQNPEKLDKYPEESPPQECPTCFPIVRFSTEHDARSHTFSHNHLQQLLKGSDFGTSLDPSRGYSSSPSSSHGSFDNSYMTDQQPCEQQQSEAFGQTTTVSSTTDCTFSQTMGRPPNCEGVDAIDSECGVNEDLSSSPDKEESDQPHEYSNALMSNPALLHQYQQAVQKMMTGNTEVMNETDAQNLHQARLQAFQQSLYKMLNIPHTSAAGGQ